MWAEGLSLTLGRERIGVRVTEPGWLSRLQALLPPGCVAASTPQVDVMYSFIVGGPGFRRGARRYHMLVEGRRVAARTDDVDEALRGFEQDLAHRALMARRGLRVRAAAVRVGDGAVLLLRDEGTSTDSLCEALLEGGALPLSCRSVWFDGDGRVHPYLPQASPQRVWPGPLGSLAALPRPLPRLVVAPRARGRARGRLDEMSAGDGILALIAHASMDATSAAHHLAVLRRVADHAHFVRTVGSEARAAAGAILARAASLRPQGADPS